jgi:hypothetical protein
MADAEDLSAIRKAVITAFAQTLMRVCRHFGYDYDDVSYSERELRLALEEAEIDVQALLNRRSRENGVSEGKLAGVYAYRLSRFKIVHFGTKYHDDKYSYAVQDISSILTVERIILKAHIGTDRLKELAYQMARRHANQETLGLCFDVIKDAYKAGLFQKG